MTTNEMMEKAKMYREYKRLAEEAQAMADSIADELKVAMTESGESKMICGEYKLSYTDTTHRDIEHQK